MTIRRRSSAEIVAFHFGWDIADMRDCSYQPTRNPVQVFTVGEHYYCAPATNKTPPKAWAWERIAEYYGRPVYRNIREV